MADVAAGPSGTSVDTFCQKIAHDRLLDLNNEGKNTAIRRLKKLERGTKDKAAKLRITQIVTELTASMKKQPRK